MFTQTVQIPTAGYNIPEAPYLRSFGDSLIRSPYLLNELNNQIPTLSAADLVNWPITNSASFLINGGNTGVGHTLGQTLGVYGLPVNNGIGYGFNTSIVSPHGLGVGFNTPVLAPYGLNAVNAVMPNLMQIAIASQIQHGINQILANPAAALSILNGLNVPAFNQATLGLGNPFAAVPFTGAFGQGNNINSVFGNPLTQLGNPLTQLCNPLTQLCNPMSQFGNPMSQFGNPMSQFVNPVSQFGNPFATGSFGLDNPFATASIAGNINQGTNLNSIFGNPMTQFGGTWPNTALGRTVIPAGICSLSPVSVIDNDTDVIYEFYAPGLTSTTTDISVVQNEIRVRMICSSKTTGTSTTHADIQGALICRLPVPTFTDPTKITAHVLGDGRVQIVVPRGADFTKMIRKVKVS